MIDPILYYILNVVKQLIRPDKLCLISSSFQYCRYDNKAQIIGVLYLYSHMVCRYVSLQHRRLIKFN